MNKCRDCIHMDVCELNPFITEFSPDNDAYCGAFKSREEYVKVKHGRWIWKGGCFHCSNCKTTNDHTPAYCEGCGAKMDLEES